jgi:hypothetical protein
MEVQTSFPFCTTNRAIDMQIHQVLLLMKYVIDEGYGVDTTKNAQISNSSPEKGLPRDGAERE